MAVMASWNGKTWGVSSQRIAALNGVSSSVELDTENSDDKAGSPATKTKALKLQSMSFDFDLAAAVGCDVRSEYESWTALVGQYAPFYLAGRRFGPANLQLTGVSLSDTKQRHDDAVDNLQSHFQQRGDDRQQARDNAHQHRQHGADNLRDDREHGGKQAGNRRQDRGDDLHEWRR